MHVTHLSLADFRSYARVEVPLDPGVTAFVGPNGQGKTNLVEAVGYLATLGSHRVSSDAPLVRMGAERAIVRARGLPGRAAAAGRAGAEPGKANRARINRSSQVRPRDVLGIVRTVLFAPEDLALVKGDPGERRRFLDELITARAPRMAGVRSDYERVLKQRNTLLKSAAMARPAAAAAAMDLSTLDVWDQHLARGRRRAARPSGSTWSPRSSRWPTRRTSSWRRAAAPVALEYRSSSGAGLPAHTPRGAVRAADGGRSPRPASRRSSGA